MALIILAQVEPHGRLGHGAVWRPAANSIDSALSEVPA
ncbi:hypothetical protein J2853_003662 [Streptosporangium lutulentum]|uniref:Uncharacterized protein n=1 Tax=Streptosporangium lutulentum TaxID=1461250 RepID=A0ABT9QCF6_9ACTN|nr:hypothetical protein [Streptosporangium lutulentum]